MDFNECIKAHSDCKMKLVAAIAEKARLEVATIAKNNCGNLGKWLHGESRVHCGPLVSHNECIRHHTEFHRQASRVAAVINEGRYAEAQHMLGSGTSYFTASQEAVMTIGKLKSEACL